MNSPNLVLITLCLGGMIFVGANDPASMNMQNQEQEKKKTHPEASAEKSEASDLTFAPVDNMHHFMEYVCEPSFKSLKAVLASEPAGRKEWKVFKNHALVLAETAVLVAERVPVPKEGPLDAAKVKQWKQISHAVYTDGKALYKSAGNYEAAKKSYVSMIDNCNKCHTAFANGKHQLRQW